MMEWTRVTDVLQFQDARLPFTYSPSQRGIALTRWKIVAALLQYIDTAGQTHVSIGIAITIGGALIFKDYSQQFSLSGQGCNIAPFQSPTAAGATPPAGDLQFSHVSIPPDIELGANDAIVFDKGTAAAKPSTSWNLAIQYVYNNCGNQIESNPGGGNGPRGQIIATGTMPNSFASI